MSYTNISYYTINFIISLYATVRSYVNYRKLKKSQYQINSTEKNELKLISRSILTGCLKLIFTVHACVMFLLLAARYLYQITLLIGTFTKATNIISTAQLILPAIASFYSLCGSTMLLIVSKQVRYDFFAFYRRKSVSVQDTSCSRDVELY